MAIYPSNVDLISREIIQDRMQEAEHWRLVKGATTWSPPFTTKLTIILRSRWKEYWSGVFHKRGYILISQKPKGKPIT